MLIIENNKLIKIPYFAKYCANLLIYFAKKA